MERAALPDALGGLPSPVGVAPAELEQGRPTAALTCDHASSLGRELGDEQRLTRLATGDRRHAVDSYIRRARSGFYAQDTD